MTSPQHRIANGQMIAGGRMTSPVNPYGQQGMVQQSQMMTNQQQNRFIRPQIRQAATTMMTIQQQQQMHQIQQQVNRQNNTMYPNSPLGSPQPIISNPQQLNMDVNIQNQQQRTMQLIQQRQQIQRQQQQQMLHQQQSNQQQAMSKMSPIQQQQQPSTTNQASVDFLFHRTIFEH